MHLVCPNMLAISQRLCARQWCVRHWRAHRDNSRRPRPSRVARSYDADWRAEPAPWLGWNPVGSKQDPDCKLNPLYNERVCSSPLSPCTCARACVYAYVCMCIWTGVQFCALMKMHIRLTVVRICHERLHSNSHAKMHATVCRITHPPTPTHIHPRTHPRPPSPTDTHTHPRTCKPPPTHFNAHTHAQKHRHTHTHAHTQGLGQGASYGGSKGAVGNGASFFAAASG